MKNQELYLGNGCLHCKFSNNTLLSFEGSKTTTSMVVGIVEYTLLKGGRLIKDEWTKPFEAVGGGMQQDQIVQVKLELNETCVVLCNAQNQIDSYIQFKNNKGKLKFKVIAEECYYTNEFQGIINKRNVTEAEFKNYIENATK